jgi:hypothetical protein
VTLVNAEKNKYGRAIAAYNLSLKMIKYAYRYFSGDDYKSWCPQQLDHYTHAQY